MRNLKGFVFDLDGTIYLGDAVLPGAVETIAGLRQRNKQICFVSNKPLEPPAAYAAKLTRLGIATRADEVVTSAFVLAHHLSKTLPHLRYYVVGERNLRDELSRCGLDVVDERDQNPQDVINPAGIDAVIVSFDRTLDYRKLNTAYQALRQGARFFATNADKVCPMPDGAIPDSGAILAALQHITGRKVELVAGKPSPLILQTALAKMKVSAEQCIMVGDRLETDIRMGREAGMATAAVLTGISNRKEIESSPDHPDFILENLSQLLTFLE